MEATLGKYIALFIFVAPLIGFTVYHFKENHLILRYDPDAKRIITGGLTAYSASDRLQQNPEFMAKYNRISYIKWGCFLAWVIAIFITTRYRYYYG